MGIGRIKVMSDKYRPRRLGNSTGSILVVLLIVLALFYSTAFWFGSRGWGYTGYYGYHRGPSFWYWGGPYTYHDPSIRSGSVRGPTARGGGIGGGK